MKLSGKVLSEIVEKGFVKPSGKVIRIFLVIILVKLSRKVLPCLGRGVGLKIQERAGSVLH